MYRGAGTGTAYRFGDATDDDLIALTLGSDIREPSA